MPQFDFSTYFSQIFWFVICFSSLYFFVTNIIIPRIRDVISSRNSTINSDVLSSKNLEKEIERIRQESQKAILEAQNKYKEEIELAVKNAAQNKEQSLQKFKNEYLQAIEKSKIEIEKMQKNSQEKSVKIVEDLTKIMENKLFN